MIAHCPKCGKFMMINPLTWDVFTHGRWFWRRTYTIRTFEYICAYCGHVEHKMHMERLK